MKKEDLAIPPTVVSAPELEARWPAVVATLAMAGLYLEVPERLTPGPNWLLVSLLLGFAWAAILMRRLRKNTLNHLFGVVSLSVMTAGLAWSLGTLIAGLPVKKETPTELLRAAVALWASNVLVFASWYWRLDAGGPNSRELRATHTEGAFLFPQMTLPKSLASISQGWRPRFVDYLFLAFNTSTAFSPTDVPVLSRWAKTLMMVQSCISLGTLAILAARAINIL
jgi:hypothetical protein